MATTPQVLDELKAKLDRDELEKLAIALYAYLDDGDRTLTEGQWDRIRESLAAVDRGEGVEVTDVDAFIDELDTTR